MSIKFNKHGLTVNNITSDNIVSSEGSKFLSEKESDLKYIGSTTVQNYNWTPDWRNNVRGVDVTVFETPVNGWLSINKSSSPIFVNGNKITTLTNNGSYQSMLKSGDAVTSETEFTYTFAPCKSEILDWREVPTDYDIWRGAIFRNDDGSVESRDLYIPDASNWKHYVYDANGLTITKVENDKGYNDDIFVCNIQCEKIKKGNDMFRNSSNLATFTSDLSSLTDGEHMFENCTNLTSFTSDLSSLTNGYYMFYGCDNLATFSSDLSSLTDGGRMFWYCSALTSFTSDLSSLTNGSWMFRKCSNLTSFTSDLSSLTNGEYMFNECKNLITFTSDLSSLTTGDYMFWYCSKLTSFTSDLSSLTTGYYMFYECDNLTTFTSDLSSLTNGEAMFYNCSALTSFTSDLSSLTDGRSMFNSCTALSSFSPDLLSLINGNSMFGYCENLTSFNSDLSSLTNGRYMFYGCSSLTTFTSNLSSLTSGEDMFNNCKLDLTSLENIANTINDITTLTLGENDGTITVHHNNSISNDDLIRVGNAIYKKGWVVSFNSIEFPTGIVTGNPFIPDASSWNEEIYTEQNLTIVRVVDGVAYNSL